MTHVLPTGTQKGSMLHRVLMTLVYGAVDSLASCSPCVVIHCVLMTSVCVAVDSLAPCSPCVAGWHTGRRGVDVAGPQLEQDEDVPVPWSPITVWKDPG